MHCSLKKNSKISYNNIHIENSQIKDHGYTINLITPVPLTTWKRKFVKKFPFTLLFSHVTFKYYIFNIVKLSSNKFHYLKASQKMFSQPFSVIFNHLAWNYLTNKFIEIKMFFYVALLWQLHFPTIIRKLRQLSK